MTKAIENMTIQTGASVDQQILVDGQPFPWPVSLQDIGITVGPEGLHVVHVPLLVESVHIARKGVSAEKAKESEDRLQAAKEGRWHAPESS